MSREFAGLLTVLAGLFAAEGRPGGDAAARALRDAATALPDLPVQPDPPLLPACMAALNHAPHRAAEQVAAALPRIRWHYSGLEDGRIREDIARAMMTTELIGPDGMVAHPTVRAGLFMQSAGVDYVTRTHAAEECFIMLGGEGWWRTGDDKARLRRAGAVIFHPSNAPHSSLTRARPLIAAWRWTGAIGYEHYRLSGTSDTG